MAITLVKCDTTGIQPRILLHMTKKVFLVDGSNHAFRVFFALPRMTAGGLNTGALLGFANMLKSIEEIHSPDAMVVVFDKGKSFRVDLYPAYKGHRPEMPEELREQWPKFPELVEAWGYKCLAIPGYEADDVIGTLATQSHARGDDVWIVTGDKDFYQLVKPRIRILDVMKKRVLQAPEVVESLGVPPELVIDLKALAGDSSDNVPGVAGVGVKTAAKYINKYGGLEDVIAHADEIGGKRGATVKEQADMARLSKVLVTIVVDVPLELGIDELAVHEPDYTALKEIFVRYQFRSHLKRLNELTGGSPLVPATSQPSSDAAAKGADKAVVPERDSGPYSIVDTFPKLLSLAGELRQQKRIAVDLETTSLDTLEAQLVGVCLSWEGTDGVYVPMGHQGEGVTQLDEATVMSSLSPILINPKIGKVGHNLKYDIAVLRARGYDLVGVAGDTMLADYLVEPARRSHSLDNVALRTLGHTMISYTEATEGLQEGFNFSHVELSKAAEYGAEDAHVTWLLDGKINKRIDEMDLKEVYYDVELPCVSVLSDMERAGILVDVERLAELSVELGKRLDVLQVKIYESAGHEFTINSPKQMQVVLFDELGLPRGKKTKTGYSTNAAVLKNLAGSHPLPGLILEYRELAKLKSTYVDTLPARVSKFDGRIHTSFHQASTATGRLASSGPNLQNIPSRTDEGRKVRECFVPKEGHVLLSADYSQVELRLLAHYCGKGGLLEAFHAGEDIHSRTAAEVFGVMQGLVTSRQRSAAKAINFGIIYGMSAFRLSNELKIPRREAQGYLDGYFDRYSEVKRALEDLKQSARDKGYAETLWGRKRIIADINSLNKIDRAAAERVALNTPLQGSAADLIKIAMVRVHERIKRESLPATLLLQVHDELVLEVESSQAKRIADIVASEMEEAAELCVPLKVDVSWGNNWSEAH